MHYGPTWDRQVSIEVLDQGFKYRIAKNTTYPTGYCWTENLTQFEQDFWVSADHAKSTTELLRYTPEAERKVASSPDVRGILCEAWEHDVKIYDSREDKNKTYTLTHHFARSDWNVIEEFSMTDKNVSSPRPLLRLVVDHKDDPGQLDSWDFVGMKPYTYNHNDFNPCNMFAAVRGCGCDLPFRNLTDPQVDPQAPALPGIYGDWAATVEETSVTKNTTISRREIFSFTHKKLRMDWGTGLDKHAMIEDFADGKKFLIVKNATYATPKCIVMDKNDRSDTNYYLDGESELRPTEYLMGYNATEERYVTGEHTVRGFPVDVWHHEFDFGKSEWDVFHAFAKDDHHHSVYYNRSSIRKKTGPGGEQQRPLARIEVSRRNDTQRRVIWDYIGMEVYEYDAADFNPCFAFGQAVDGCGCGDAHDDDAGDAPEFPGLFKQWSAVIQTVNLDKGFSTHRREIYIPGKRVRIDTGYYRERLTKIWNEEEKKSFVVIRNSTYPEGFCSEQSGIGYASKIPSSVSEKTEDGITTSELIQYEQRVGKAHHTHVPGDFKIKGIPVHAFESEVKIRGREYHLHHYFSKQGWTHKYVKGIQEEAYVDTNVYTDIDNLLLRVIAHDKAAGTETIFDFVDYEPYKMSKDDFDPCKITGGVEGCGCDSLVQDLCKMSEEEIGGLAAGLFFIGFIVATLLSCVWCKFKKSRRPGAYAKYNDNGI